MSFLPLFPSEIDRMPAVNQNGRLTEGKFIYRDIENVKYAFRKSPIYHLELEIRNMYSAGDRPQSSSIPFFANSCMVRVVEKQQGILLQLFALLQVFKFLTRSLHPLRNGLWLQAEFPSHPRVPFWLQFFFHSFLFRSQKDIVRKINQSKLRGTSYKMSLAHIKTVKHCE